MSSNQPTSSVGRSWDRTAQCRTLQPPDTVRTEVHTCSSRIPSVLTCSHNGAQACSTSACMHRTIGGARLQAWQ
eukprot:1153391-Pelagomonas_calceolata.AAC.12